MCAILLVEVLFTSVTRLLNEYCDFPLIDLPQLAHSELCTKPSTSQIFTGSPPWPLTGGLVRGAMNGRATMFIRLIALWHSGLNFGVHNRVVESRRHQYRKIQISSGAYGIEQSVCWCYSITKGLVRSQLNMFPCATARNTEQALLATQLNGVTQTWLRDMLYKNRILPGQASSARSLLCTVQDKCFAPGCWHYCKE